MAIAQALFQLRAEPNLRRRPDAAFVSFDRWPEGRWISLGHAWDVVPELVVEVVSPTNTAEEKTTKVREDFEAGVRRARLIDVQESLVYEYGSARSIRVLGRDEALEGGAMIPGSGSRWPTCSRLTRGPTRPDPFETPRGRPERIRSAPRLASGDPDRLAQ